MRASKHIITDVIPGETLGAQIEAPVRRSIDAATERALRGFLREVESRYAVVETRLYGSRARGDFRQDSDADIAVVLQGRRGDRAAVVHDMAVIAFHVMMDTGVMVEGLPLWEDEFADPMEFSNPKLIENIRREGLRL
jgi:predicted nucleotidyltransferase